MTHLLVTTHRPDDVLCSPFDRPPRLPSVGDVHDSRKRRAGAGSRWVSHIVERWSGSLAPWWWGVIVDG